MQVYYLSLIFFNRPVSKQKLSKYFSDEDIEFFEFLGWIQEEDKGGVKKKWDGKEIRKV
jgi:hypothetical protein